MLMGNDTLLQRLQAGALLDSPVNNWRWDFRSDHNLATEGQSRCTQECRNWYAPVVRSRVNRGTVWAHLDGDAD